MKTPLVAIVSMILFACSSTPDHPAFNDAGYVNWLDTTVEAIMRKPDYRRIPLDTDAQENHFYTVSHQAYSKQISKQQFIADMEVRYSGYSESIEWLADRLPE